MTNKEKVIAEVNTIPYGKVSSYGEIGKRIGVSGYLVGIILSGLSVEECEKVAWQRVVAKDGSISTLKLGYKGVMQISLLEAEDIKIVENKVDSKFFI